MENRISKRTPNEIMSELATAQKHVSLLKHELEDTKQLHEAYEAGLNSGKMLKALLDGFIDAGIKEEQAFALMMLTAESVIVE